MNTKTIYVLLSLIAVAAVATSLEITYPSKSGQRSAAVRGKSSEIEPGLDLENSLEDFQVFKREFKDFHEDLFKCYRSASGHNLKVLGEAVSYSGEIDTTLDTLPTILLLSEMAKNTKESLLITQSWVERTKTNMEMHLYFIRRMANDSGIDSKTSEIVDRLSHQVDAYQELLGNLNQSLTDIGAARKASQNLTAR